MNLFYFTILIFLKFAHGQDDQIGDDSLPVVKNIDKYILDKVEKLLSLRSIPEDAPEVNTKEDSEIGKRVQTSDSLVFNPVSPKVHTKDSQEERRVVPKLLSSTDDLSVFKFRTNTFPPSNKQKFTHQESKERIRDFKVGFAVDNGNQKSPLPSKLENRTSTSFTKPLTKSIGNSTRIQRVNQLISDILLLLEGTKAISPSTIKNHGQPVSSTIYPTPTKMITARNDLYQNLDEFTTLVENAYTLRQNSKDDKKYRNNKKIDTQPSKPLGWKNETNIDRHYLMQAWAKRKIHQPNPDHEINDVPKNTSLTFDGKQTSKDHSLLLQRTYNAKIPQQKILFSSHEDSILNDNTPIVFKKDSLRQFSEDHPVFLPIILLLDVILILLMLAIGLWFCGKNVLNINKEESTLFNPNEIFQRHSPNLALSEGFSLSSYEQHNDGQKEDDDNNCQSSLRQVIQNLDMSCEKSCSEDLPSLEKDPCPSHLESQQNSNTFTDDTLSYNTCESRLQ